jgi:hypothetical protein
MYRLPEKICIRESGGSLALTPWERDATVEIRGLTSAKVEELGSTLVCSWGGHGHDPQKLVPVLPQNISTAYHLVDLWDGQNARLRLIEHWGSLPVLLQTPLHLHFPTGYTPYSAEALTNAALQIWETRERVDEIPHVTFLTDYVWTTGAKDCPQYQEIRFHPLSQRNVRIEGSFDFSLRGKNLQWVGKVEAALDVATITKTTLPQVTSARVPKSHPIPDWLIRLLGRKSALSYLVSNPAHNGHTPMRENEPAFHKIGVDFPVCLNIGPHFLAARIEVVNAGHAGQIEAIQRVTQFVKRNLVKI